jgi:hypothetical protein
MASPRSRPTRALLGALLIAALTALAAPTASSAAAAGSSARTCQASAFGAYAAVPPGR